MSFELILRGCAAALWLVFFAAIIFIVIRATRGQSIKILGFSVIGLVIIAVFVSILAAGLIFIEPTDRGVVISALDDGVRSEPLQPGLHFVVPYLENVIRYPVMRQTYTMSFDPTVGEIQGDDSVEVNTADGETVNFDASVIFSIDPDRVVEVHIKWQRAYLEHLVRPQARGVIRDAVPQFDFEEICNSHRFALAEMIAKELRDRFDEGGLILNDFVLRKITPCDP